MAEYIPGQSLIPGESPPASIAADGRPQGLSIPLGDFDPRVGLEDPAQDILARQLLEQKNAEFRSPTQEVTAQRDFAKMDPNLRDMRQRLAQSRGHIPAVSADDLAPTVQSPLQAQRARLNAARNAPSAPAGLAATTPSKFPGMTPVSGTEQRQGLDIDQATKDVIGEQLAAIPGEQAKLNDDIARTSQARAGLESRKEQTVLNAQDYARQRYAMADEQFKASQRQGQKLVSDITAKNDELVKERAGMKIENLVSRASTGKKIMMGLAIALGGIGRAMANPGGKNTALETIMNNVRQDYDEQIANINGMDDRIAMNRARIGDAERAREALKQDALLDKQGVLLKTEMDIQRMMLQAGQGEAEIAANETLNSVRGERLADREKLLASMSDKVSTNLQHQKLIIQHGAKQDVQGKLIFGANGQPIAAIEDKKRAGDINEANQTYRALRDTVQKLKGNVEKEGNELWPWSDVVKEREALQVRAIALANRGLKLGAMDKGTQEILEKAFGAGQFAGVTNAAKGLDTSLVQMDEAHRAYLNGQGLPADQFFDPMVGGSSQSSSGRRGQAKLKDGTTVTGTFAQDGQFYPDE